MTRHNEPATNLPDTTTDRLLAVADLIEFTPQRWEQRHHYFEDPDTPGRDDERTRPYEVAGAVVSCGTTACIAGWGVVLNPRFQTVVGLCWSEAGRDSLGLESDLADVLFDGSLKGEPSEVADILRYVAKHEEGERTLDAIEDDLPPRLVEVLQTSYGYADHRDVERGDDGDDD